MIKIENILLYLIALAAGTFFGDIFFHIMPELIEEQGWFTFQMWILIIGWLLLWIVIEKILRWHHCHHPVTHHHIHHIGYMSIIGDIVHNFIDGMLIAASFLTSVEVGIATTIAVILHEIPQEIWDFGILLHAWYTKKKALWVNFLVSLTAILWCMVTFVFASYVDNIALRILPLSVGLFLYIAWSDLIPEMHREDNSLKSLIQVLVFIWGVGLMIMILWIENHESDIDDANIVTYDQSQNIDLKKNTHYTI
jgi:zinc and cadmium transporter